MKYFPFSLIFCVLFILSRNIYSDIIYLKDGTKKEGVFINSDEKYLELDTFDRKIKIPVGNVKSVEVGFSGTPVCVRFRNNSMENCDYQLHSLSEDRIILLSGSGFLEVASFAPNDLSQILWMGSKNNRITPYLREGIYVEIQTSSTFYKGKIIGFKSQEILIEDQDRINNVAESEIKRLIYKPQSSQLYNNIELWIKLSSHLIPGYPQYEQGNRIKGSALMSLSVLSIFGATSEFSQAKSLSKVNYNFYSVNNRIIIQQDSKSRKKSIRSQQNGNALLGLFFVIFIYHLWDLNYDTVADSNSTEAMYRNINHLPSTGVSQWELISEQQNEIFRFQLSF
ncbi:MAG: hypothetical protein JJT78_02545 [Leptospira sp.]|nr:hypothetical protein [Leptospira sp.]